MKRTVLVTVYLVTAVGLMLTLPAAVTAAGTQKCVPTLGKPGKPGLTTRCLSAEGIAARKMCWRICHVYNRRRRCRPGAKVCRYKVLSHFVCVRTNTGCVLRFKHGIGTAPCIKKTYCYYKVWRCKCVVK